MWGIWVLLLSRCVGALVSSPRRNGIAVRTQRRAPLLRMSDEAESDDVTNAYRVMLDAMMAGGDAAPAEPKISGTRKRLRLKERELIQQIGDAALVEDVELATGLLWQFWFTEYGQANCVLLQEVDALLAAGPLSWDEAARRGERLSVEMPDWAEPLNRLATLRYLQGAFQDSVALCERVLALKPHHFGAASGIVMCHRRLGDNAAAGKWAQRALPMADADAARRANWARDRLAEFAPEFARDAAP
ncbi:hypothetical protein M885DRAFT_518455 [Pelagophyceae sp. CCMP2097]|nr:hypothetical protein M885DRAFT_518455 [Pelagophyceae sp. CCMP2097]